MILPISATTMLVRHRISDMQDFRNLEVWHKAHALVIDIHKTLERHKRVDVHMRSQLSRAARSIPSNLVEGCGADSQAELARFAGMAIRSSSEVEYWILLGKDLGYLPPSDFERITSNVVEVRRMLFGFRRALRNGRKPKPAAETDASPPA